ncbi:hypothetical protein CMT41_07515 [Colwellia sp. MT41]|uniref:hypothetical protein n=1 Tax=Colwellia sp. MT41 TaxID=58049 RepID=UPI0007175FEE|nr:hypothetical protein [Colwellia sp. MT41]ALO34578.1 hypothetical protein CMT41_07515 [Colwellia sp. MT41]
MRICSLPLIKECKDDEDLKNELAQYFCDFFYKLKSEIVINCKVRNKDIEISPFDSLYLKYIYQVENRDYDSEEDLEDALKNAREVACEFNENLRSQDKVNSNPVIKTLAKIGGLIRKMEDWEEVIENLQSKILSQKDGKFFQVGNDELLEIRESTGEPIATLNTDNKSINIQVMTATLKTIEDFFLQELSLNRESKITLCINDKFKKDWVDGELNYTHSVSRKDKNYLDINVQFDVGYKVDLKPQELSLRVEPSIAWKGSKFNGKKSIKAKKIEKFKGYQDEFYGSGIKRLEAQFEVTLPAYDNNDDDMFDIKFYCSIPMLNGLLEIVTFTLRVQPELMAIVE